MYRAVSEFRSTSRSDANHCESCADDPVIGRYRVGALVSDMDLPAETIWRTDRGRANCENRTKELKYDFASDSFNLKDFWATEAALNTVMLAYNLMRLFRQVLLKTAVSKGGVRH